MKKILFLANSEHGQTNIILALMHELILHRDIDIHIASFPVLRRRVDKLLHDNAPRYHAENIPTTSRVHFHEVRGPSNTDVFLRTGKRGAFHPPGATGAVLGFKSLIEDIWGWNEEEYVDVYNSCLDILNEVNPDLVVVDFFFLQGRDAAHNMGHTAVLMNTTSLSHIVLGLQKYSSPLWKYPLPGTGFPYPLPLHLIPANAWALLQTAKMYHGSGRRREIRSWRIKHHIKGRFPFADAWRPGRIHLSPALKELDWPMEVPDNVIPCGPILLPVASVENQDPEMASWLQRGPTILVNLGTLYAPDPTVAWELASGITSFLESWQDNSTQVLWKLPKHPFDKDDVYDTAIEPLRAYMRVDRVRVRPWFDVEPMAMLETGRIVCSVHHGGANSWYEAIQTGVPHVILPAWQDCYENAARAEWIGIGVYGNKSCAPDINGQELSAAMRAVVGNSSYREKAAVLKLKCETPGRVVGCSKLVELLHHPERMAMDMPKFEDKEVSHVQHHGKVLDTVPAKKTSKYASLLRLLVVYWLTIRSFTKSMAETAIVTLLTNAWLLLPAIGYGLLLVPRLRVVLLLYIVYIKFRASAHTTGTLSHRSDRFRTSRIWTFFASYFPLTLYRSARLLPQKRYIFGYHPHGIALRGAIGALASDAAGFSHLFPGITNTLLMKDEAFRVPLLREYLLASGLGGVSRGSCINHLIRGGHDGRGMGRAITITVGGSREYAIARPGTMGIVVRIRKGFIRVAVETGADLVPVVAFGENELFTPVDVNSSLLKQAIARVWEAFVRHPVSFATGRWGTFVPYRHPVRVVVGEPISVVQQRWEQDEKYIDSLQEQYIGGLRGIYNDWKGVLGDSSIEFEIVE